MNLCTWVLMLELMINDCTYLAINTSTHSSECKDTKQKLHIYTCTYLIKLNDNHNVLLRNAYLEDKQLYIYWKKNAGFLV